MTTNLSNIRAPKNSSEKRKRVGRGMGSGMGKTSTRGHKGQRSRSGSRMMRGFEGGQMPLHRRMPKRGFTNIFRKEWMTVSVEGLERAFSAGDTVDAAALKTAGLVKKSGTVKVLGTGEITKALVVSAHKFTEGAKKKIEAAGGRCEVLSA